MDVSRCECTEQATSKRAQTGCQPTDLRRRLEGNGRVGPPEVGQPLRHHLLGDQVYLVQDQHQLLPRPPQNQLLHRLRPRAEGVARVEHLEDDVGRLHHLPQVADEGPAGLLAQVAEVPVWGLIFGDGVWVRGG